MLANSLALFFSQCAQAVEETLTKALLAQQHTDHLTHRLHDAALYSVTNGGKRLRPALVYSTALAIKSDMDTRCLSRVAASVEAMHCYSLVHDDLPSMDDDALRRGKPTCHIAYDEATAILAGDGLQSLGFELLANDEGFTDRQRIQMIQTLAKAIGNEGMVLGQAFDLFAENKTLTPDALARIHDKKTGALIRASVKLGAIAANAPEDTLSALDIYAANLGLAFQVQDDILDIESDTSTLGKQQGADLDRNKSTYPQLLGLTDARNKAQSLVDSAKCALDDLPLESSRLRQIADFVIDRKF